MKRISDMTTEEILNQLTYQQKDDIYRALWQKHVEEDVATFDESLHKSTVEIIAYHYVYDGDYDCNLSYWGNIENLIEKYKHLDN